MTMTAEAWLQIVGHEHNEVVNGKLVAKLQLLAV